MSLRNDSVRIVGLGVALVIASAAVGCSHDRASRAGGAREIFPASFTEPTAALAVTGPAASLKVAKPYAEILKWIVDDHALPDNVASRIEDKLDALADDAGNPELRIELAEILMEVRQYELAIAPLRDAFFLRPGLLRAAAMLADAYVQAGRESEALALARKLVDDNPHSHGRWLFRAEVARRAGLLDEAIRSSQTTLLIRPEVSQAKAVLGFIYANRGNTLLAKKLLEEVAGKDGIQTYAVEHRLGRMALDEENYSAAIEHLERSLDDKPDYAAAHNDLGLVYTKLGRWDDARMQFEKAVKADENLAEAQVNLANLYIDDELDAKARLALQKASQVGTNPAAFFVAAGRLYALSVSTSAGRSAAIRYFRKARPLVGGETRAQIDRAMEKFASLPPPAEPMNEPPVQAADVPDPVSVETPRQSGGASKPSIENPRALGQTPSPNGPPKHGGPNEGGAEGASEKQSNRSSIDDFRPAVE